ncbi:TonB-dependent receptor [Nonlabens ulvanivorans]|nr:carboxypeptidase-like regulatory domain-containing protein [Nonlabens ulvanivorans]GAK89388.1 TonB-dependent receptor [Nonlabens ulvanivorans]
MKQSLLLFLFLYCSCSIAQRTITGTVTDDSGELILGATVLVKGINKVTTTDFDGHYSIEAKDENVLVFSFPGYKKQNILVGSQNIIDVIFDEELTEVVTLVHYYRKTFAVSTNYGFNYNTVGLGIYKRLRYPFYIDLNASISSDFNINKEFEFSLSKSLSITSFYFEIGIKHEQADFNFNNFKKNELFLIKK